MHEITLIGGGARCGKSAFALSLALRGYGRRVFVATAAAVDEEMRERIRRHQVERADRFRTVEAPLELGRTIAHLPPGTDVAVVDCLTVWLGNLYHRWAGQAETIETYLKDFLDQLAKPPCDLILVTNEVGWGIVPENPMARSFRDTAGRLNRQVAEKASRVYLMSMGIPLPLKEKST